MGTITMEGFSDTTEASTTNAEATISGNVAVTAVSSNSGRSALSISILNADAWVRLMPAATDGSVRKGIAIGAGDTWELPTSWWRRLYSGEVSIINVADGETPSYYVTEL